MKHIRLHAEESAEVLKVRWIDVQRLCHYVLGFTLANGFDLHIREDFGLDTILRSSIQNSKASSTKVNIRTF